MLSRKQVGTRALLVLATVLLACTEARAENEIPTDAPLYSQRVKTPFETRPWTVEAHVGAGTPVGALGIMLEYLVTPALSVAGGAGIGSGPPDRSGSDIGFHGALALRVRPVTGKHHALFMESAFSTGGYRRYELDLGLGHGDSTSRGSGVSAEWAHFLQFAVGWERRATSGFLVRIDTGLAMMLNPEALHGTETSSETLFVFDLAVGQSF